jgi:hypothetical protein
MLPLAYTIGMLINMLLLMHFFQKRFGTPLIMPLRKSIGYSVGASFLGGFVSYQFLVVLGLHLNLNTFWGIFLQGLGGGAAGILTWWLLLEVTGNEDIREFRHAISRKIGKAGIIISNQEEL